MTISAEEIVSFAADAMTVADRCIEISLGTVAQHDMIRWETGFDLAGVTSRPEITFPSPGA